MSGEVAVHTRFRRRPAWRHDDPRRPRSAAADSV